MCAEGDRLQRASQKADGRRVGAAVVTYHPDVGFADRFARVAVQVEDVLVVDNSADSRVQSELARITANCKCRLVTNPKNLGLAAALNQACSWAMDSGFDWILLLDQDSECSSNMLQRVSQTLAQIGDLKRVAVFGCNYSERAEKHSSEKGLWTEVATVITSGSLLNIAAYRKLGPFREDLFIDGIDLEYCLRARRQGLHVLQGSESLVQHKLGSPSYFRFLGRRVGTTNHSPIRRYFMLRNEMAVWREYWRNEPLWVLRQLLSRVKSMLLMLIFEKERRTKLKFALLGLWDGLRGKSGRDTSRAFCRVTLE